ncbi:MAG: hypothetical protein AB8I08_00595 [Sandaracinaceae bacterium]
MFLRRSFLWLAPTALVLALALGPGSGVTPTAGHGQEGQGRAAPALADFAGTWALAGGRGSLEEGIDRVVDELNLFIREIARLEMRRRITPEQQIRLTSSGPSNLALSWDEWGPHRLSLGSARSLDGPQGQRIRVSVTMRNGNLVHHHRADNGNRFTTYSLSSDREQMTMAVRITSDQLPSDIRYRLRYRRTD